MAANDESLRGNCVGTIDDVGQAAVFLMTNACVTGSVLEVSGGETLMELDVR
jgi:hypothetical protein